MVFGFVGFVMKVRVFWVSSFAFGEGGKEDGEANLTAESILVEDQSQLYRI
jgi:hypothetical protein